MTEPMPAHGADAHNIPDPQDLPMLTFDGTIECNLSVRIFRTFTVADQIDASDLDDAQDAACESVRSFAEGIVHDAISDYLRGHPELKFELDEVSILTAKAWTDPADGEIDYAQD